MSDGEFENYLTLISRFLRLSPAQREAIGEELRDHFESRLAELIDRGVPHDEAVRISIDEFGDAAGLAANFTSISQIRRRRLIMRCTVASVAALAAAVIVAMSMWPENHAGRVVNNASAQAKETNQAERPSPKTVELLTAATELELNKLIAAEYVETPLKDVITHLSDQYKIQFYYHMASLRDAAIDPTSTMVSANFKNIRIGRLLEWLLAEHQMGYTVRDGIVVIATKDWLNTQVETRVYDCRDIVGPSAYSAVRAVSTGGFGANPSTKNPFNKEQPDVSKAVEHTQSADRLVDLISRTIAHDTWSTVGGPGTAGVYEGLLVVSQTADVQNQVAELLDQLNAKLAAKPKASPPK